ncbi:phosphomethylpyrimidine synthase ThiC [Micromonospora sp. CA-249363]|uniref:phosphomethylpyrimidine synthase ThiC n=1 Tax=Micromonospora sp. CA-249363 TaxID=3239963 RepID=UPI003D9472AB
MTSTPPPHVTPRSFLIRNPRHEITGVRMGGDAPPLLDVIIGLTKGQTTFELEYAKATTAAEMGVSMLTDVSFEGDPTLRRTILRELDVACRTVPTYNLYAAIRAGQPARSALLSILTEQADEGVDYFTLHASATRKQLLTRRHQERTIPITSRGGAMMAELMLAQELENPILTYFDDILDLCAEAGIALSLAATFRVGSVHDVFSAAHMEEIMMQSDLVTRAHQRGVNVSVELIGHTPLDRIAEHCEIGHHHFDGAPFGALGPLPTDIAMGYDDVAGAVGAATAVMHGTPWLACLTAGEHTYIPTHADLVRAIKYLQIAVHIGMLGRTGDTSRDQAMSRARSENDWSTMCEIAIHPKDAADIVERHGYRAGQPCSMCRRSCPLVRFRGLERRYHGADPGAIAEMSAQRSTQSTWAVD